ncbi:Ff.00g063190.m01.CDS01 [Fusarium sp. VM40]|nr:Ff.00g063190.m01.CDS01 [Fusarium sp. VM40]
MHTPVYPPIVRHKLFVLSPAASDVELPTAYVKQKIATNKSSDGGIKSIIDHIRLITQEVVLQHTTSSLEETQQRDFLRGIIRAFDQICLRGENIHVAVQKLDASTLEKTSVIQSYYAAAATSGLPILPHNSALLSPRRSSSTPTIVYAIFGGQGISGLYLDELRYLLTTYQSLIKSTLRASEELLLSLLHVADAPDIYAQGLAFINWLESDSSVPSREYLSSAPVSFPLIGILQLVSYEVTCKTLGLHPGQLRDSLSGTSGHSQGLIAAAAIAIADSWESWRTATRVAVTALFWLGMRTHQFYRPAAISPAMIKDSEMHGEGIPTSMLHLRGFERDEIQTQVSKANKKLRPGSQIALSLINGPKNFVCSGSSIGLYGLNRQLRKLKQQDSRTSRYLPVSAPFHNECLATVPDIVYRDLDGVAIHSSDLKIPLYCTRTGRDLNSYGDDIIPELLRLVLSEPLDWEAASAFPGATHIVDFGPGGVHGIGSLTDANKKGKDVKVVLAATMQGTSSTLGYQAEIFQGP